MLLQRTLPVCHSARIMEWRTNNGQTLGVSRWMLPLTVLPAFLPKWLLMVGCALVLNIKAGFGVRLLCQSRFPVWLTRDLLHPG